MNDWVSEDRFSGAVLLARNDRIIFSRAYGFSNRSIKKPNTVETRFRVGSINKFFTAIATLLQVQAGKIALSDTVGKYIKDYPNKEIGGKVTIHQLLTHTGGTGDFFGPEFNARHTELRALNDYMALDPMRALAFQPGERVAYSNYGYVLLGAVIERVSSENYYDYVRQHVYVPAGMNSSETPPEDQEVTNCAVGYMKPLGTTLWIANTDTLPNRGSSAGGGLSTVGDLQRFSQALLAHKLLSAEYTDLLISAKPTPGYRGIPLGYGFADLRGEDGSGWIGGNGGAEGMNAHLRIYPKSGYVIAVLSNFDPPAADRVAAFIDRHLMH
jgi:CubicO group peptidase (beta-lactamase class C family)